MKLHHLVWAVALLSVLLARPGDCCGQHPDRDFKDIDLQKDGIPEVETKKDARTAFLVGGKNTTKRIGQLTEINVLSIVSLEDVMRPGQSSLAGFLGNNENLLDILAADNKNVGDERGLTHQELARHLHAMGAVAAMLEKKGDAM